MSLTAKKRQEQFRYYEMQWDICPSDHNKDPNEKETIRGFPSTTPRVLLEAAGIPFWIMFHCRISNTLLPIQWCIHCHLSHGGLVAQLCLTLVTAWTVAHKAPLSLGFSRQEYWRGLPFPSPGDLPNPGIEPRSPALQNLYRLSYQQSPACSPSTC